MPNRELNSDSEQLIPMRIMPQDRHSEVIEPDGKGVNGVDDQLETVMYVVYGSSDSAWDWTV